MSLIDRFTRDTASKYVWAAMALAAAGGLVFAITNGARALDEERANAQARAVGYVEEALDPRLASGDLVTPITGQQAASLDEAIQRSILADDRLSRVRIWSSDGRLLFSTDGSDTPGSNAGLNDALLRQASREDVLTRSNVSDTGGQNDAERSLLRTYVAFRATAVAEIDQTDAGTLAAVRTEWRYYELLAGVALLLLLVMTGLSLRDPIEPINVGVPFAASSIPAGFSLIDDERLHAVQEVYRLASERVGRLQEKLDASEAARRRLEGDIQRALSKASTSPRPAAAAAAAAAAPPPTPPPAPRAGAAGRPGAGVRRRGHAALGDTWAASPAGPLARATRDQKPPPTTARRAKPVAPKPKKTVKRRRRRRSSLRNLLGKPRHRGPHLLPSHAWRPWRPPRRLPPSTLPPIRRSTTRRRTRPLWRRSSASPRATGSRTTRAPWTRGRYGRLWRERPHGRSPAASGSNRTTVRPRSRPTARLESSS